MSITETVMSIVNQTIKKYDMLHNGDTVVLGVSGGADSVVLLHIFTKLREQYNLNLKVAHVNHKIRKGDAERDADFVKDLCFKWSVEYYLREAYIKTLAKEWGLGEEEAGRQVRYGFFNELAGQNGKVATAHNANDNVETVLMRMMRGTGINGLCGISFCRDNIIRPLLGVPRDMIEKYISENGLTHITDSTNLVPIYTRNKIRLNLIPDMQKFNPQFFKVMTDMIQSINEDSDYIDSQVDAVYNSISTVNCKTVNGDCRYFKFENMDSLHSSILKRVFMRAAKDIMGNAFALSQNDIDMCMNYKEYSVGSVIVLKENFRLRVDYEGIWLEKFDEMPDIDMTAEYDVNFEDETGHYIDFADKSIWFSVEIDCKIDNNSMKVNLPYNKYKNKTLTLRHRRNGDILRIDDNTHKKLNKFLVDKKVPQIDRDKLWVLCDGNEVLWILGLFGTRFEKRSGVFFHMNCDVM